ncbi:zinc finger domain-containing protein [Streptomyces sp. S465]|uniref:zinc finger domain-containing protein n=1 Tax=Streptomyces sp. S465 TaxID=2979468 RepID=UPI003FCC3F4C
MHLTPDQAANAVERNDCPKCESRAGSPCRTRAGKTAAKYHTPRFILVPTLREELEVLVPVSRGPGRPWKSGPLVEPQGYRSPCRSGSDTPAARPRSRNSSHSSMRSNRSAS